MSYIVISKELFKNPLYNSVSAEAKLLYGFLVDRSKLSEKNGEAWMDQNNEFFVYYPQTEIMERFCCGHDKARRLIRELEDAQLIQRTRQGLGLPHRLVVKEVIYTTNNTHNEERKSSTVECGKVAGNNTYYDNKSDINKPDSMLFRDKMLIEKQIKENVCYDVLTVETDQYLLDSILEVIVETLCKSTKVIRIAGEEKPISEVSHRFMALNDMHLRYIIDRIKREENVIFSPKGYILRHLFYADQEMDIYYASRVAHDEKTRRNNL